MCDEVDNGESVVDEVDNGESMLIDRREAAKLLNVSDKTLYNHTAPRGKCIPAVRLGKTLRYRRAALERWIREQENGQVVETAGG